MADKRKSSKSKKATNAGDTKKDAVTKAEDAKHADMSVQAATAESDRLEVEEVEVEIVTTDDDSLHPAGEL